MHTILRLPEGTFTPYAAVKANVLFFIKGIITKEIWIYDLRTEIPTINKGNTLTETLFQEFEESYNKIPRQETNRFKSYSIDDIEKRDYDLEIFPHEGKSIVNSENIKDPVVLANDAIKKLQFSVDSLNQLVQKLK